MKQNFEVKGMSCVICRNAVEKGLRNINGVHEAVVNLMDNEVFVDYDEHITNPTLFKKELEKLGYELISEKRKSSDKETIKLIVSCVLMVILMIVSMTSMKDPSETMLIQLFLAGAIILLHLKRYISGFRSLLHFHPNMDSLVSLSSFASYLYSLYAITRISHGKMVHLYFETSAMVLVIVSIGKKLEEKNKKKTGRLIRGLSTLIPMQANLVVDDKVSIIPIDELKKGDTILIKAGESIPQDASVISGTSYVDESLITGESSLVYKTKDSPLIGGTVNSNGELIAVVSKNSLQTTLSKIISLTKQATMKKIPSERIADTLSHYFVFVILGISLITFVSWLIIAKDIEKALNYALSVLVISCPCALGLATPAAVAVACSTSLKNGVLIKNPEILEKCGKIKTILFDKTGTLSENKIKILKVIELDPSLIPVLSSLEAHSNHPIAKAIKETFHDNSLTLNSTEEISGEGIISSSYWAGNEILARKYNCFIKEEYREYGIKEAATIIYVGNKDRLLGVIYLADEIRPSAYDLMKDLKKENITSIMATGDNETVAYATGNKLSINEVYANVKPEDKQNLIESAKQKGLVMMVGDGINDAIALSLADVSLTMESGTDIASASADAILLYNNLNDIYYLIRLSRLTMKKIKQNLFWALGYNALFIPLAAGIFASKGITLNPMIGAFTMSVSNAFVLFNAFTISKLKKEEKRK